MLKQQTKILLCVSSLALGLVALGTGCAIPDGDLQNSGVAGFSVTPSSYSVDVLTVDVSGDATLAYLSADAATVEILVNGRSSYTSSLDASTVLGLKFAATLPLFEGTNEVVANITYNGNRLSDTFVVTVAEGVQGITLTPASASVTGFDVDVTLGASLGYTSAESAMLEIAVNGQVVHSQSIDASTSKTANMTVNIPLERVGPNQVVATLRYHGNEMTQRSTVIVNPASPGLDFPSWSSAFTQSGDVNITMDSAWTVDEVAFSVDSGEFLPAASQGSGAWQLALTNLDVGDSALTVRVTSSNGGHEQVHLFHSTISGIVPVFNCGNVSAMQPTANLLRNNRTEVRTMIGYFGDPYGGHTISFVLNYITNRNNTNTNVTTMGAVVNPGRTAMDVEFQTDGFRCNNNNNNNVCPQPYSLQVLFDGAPVCSNATYGSISEL